MTGKTPRDALQADTLHGSTLGASSLSAAEVIAPVLTILWHPDVSRVGERSRLNDPGGQGRVRLSRLQPAFGPPTGPDAAPLGLPHLSRRPIYLEPLASGAMRIVVEPDATPLKVDGQIVTEPRTFTPAELQRGVVLELARRVVLLLHTIPPIERDQQDHGLVGASAAIRDVREQIERVARHDVPVLLRGENGTGKELVAQAIHRASARSGGPMVAVNMAALVATTAASQLFGHDKGAFTGASTKSEGLFGMADGGTLFMDEIGETPDEIQPALLRALESGEVQPVGASAPHKRNVRIIAATDRRLEQAVQTGRFRMPLLQRLAGYEVHLPPLRERREDIGRLMLAFLREFLAPGGKLELLSSADGAKPWLPAEVVTRAALAPWPGNVRELRNFVQRLVIDHASEPSVALGPRFDQLLPDPGSAPAPPPSQGPSTDVDTLDDPADTDAGRKLLRDIPEADLLAALRRHDFRPGPAAKELGVSRTSLYALIETSDKVRKAGSLTVAEIQKELDACGGDVRAAARALEVSERGLRLRMTQLGMA